MKDDLEAWIMIADELGEKDFAAREQLKEVVAALGEPAAFALLERVLAIEDAGGERLADGVRRRTAGGVFFRMARQKLPRDAIQRIFFGKGRGGVGARGVGAPSAPAPGAPASAAGHDRPIAPPLPRARRRVVEVAKPRGAPVTPAESGEFAVASQLDVARATIEHALEPLTQAQQRTLLEELQSKLERAATPARRRTRQR